MTWHARAIRHINSEPPTLWLTAECASRLRHRACNWLNSSTEPNYSMNFPKFWFVIFRFFAYFLPANRNFVDSSNTECWSILKTSLTVLPVGVTTRTRSGRESKMPGKYADYVWRGQHATSAALLPPSVIQLQFQPQAPWPDIPSRVCWADDNALSSGSSGTALQPLSRLLVLTATYNLKLLRNCYQNQFFWMK